VFFAVIQALALLIDFLDREDTTIRIGAILGLGIAYAGTHKDEVGTEVLSYYL
jgi:26S proteasome regulatory subunit N1